jgi:hypothetical protein
MDDLTLCVYIATFIVGLAGFGLFTWWLIRMRGATEVFIYVGLLLLFISIERGLLAIFRYFTLFDIEKALWIINHGWWPLRTIPELVIVTLIVIRMSRRACRTIRLERKHGKSDTCEGSMGNEE